MIHGLYTFTSAAAGKICVRARVPYILHPHGTLAPFQRTVSRRKKRLYDARVTRDLISHAAARLYTSDGERHEAEAIGVRGPALTVPLGIDTHFFQDLPMRGEFRSALGLPPTGRLVLFMGRLDPKKGLELLIDAMRILVASHPDAHLMIAGRAEPREFDRKLQTWIRESGVQDRIHLVGFLDGRAKVAAFADADVWVLPSRAENFGVARLEAMAAGVPVVISDQMSLAGRVASSHAGLVGPRPRARCNENHRAISERAL